MFNEKNTNSNGEKKYLPEEKLEKIMDEMLDEKNISKLLSESIGEEIHVDKTPEREEKIKDWMRSMNSLFKQLEEAPSTEAKMVVLKQLIKLIDVPLSEVKVESDIPIEANSGIEWLYKAPKFLLKSAQKALRQKGYEEHVELLNNLAYDIIKHGKFEEVRKLQNNQDTNKLNVLTQGFLNSMPEYGERIIETKTIESKEELDYYIDAYRELSGLYEKLLAFFIAVLQIRSGKQPEYHKLENCMRLGNMLKKLRGKKFEKFYCFAEGIDAEIRNSLSHTDYFIKPSTNDTIFVQNDSKDKELSFNQFKEKTESLFISTFTLFLLWPLIQLLHFELGPGALLRLLLGGSNS